MSLFCQNNKKMAMTAGQFINHPLLHSHFGSSRVAETGRRLREMKGFPRGTEEVGAKSAAVFLYVLFATKNPTEVIEAVQNGLDINSTPYGSIIDFISKIISDQG